MFFLFFLFPFYPRYLARLSITVIRNVDDGRKEWKENTFNSHTLALKKVTKVRTESKKENMLKIFIDESRHIFVEWYNL